MEDAIDKGNKARDKAIEVLNDEQLDSDKQDAEMKKQYAEAERWYRRAALLAPRDSRPYDGLGNVFSDWGRHDEAIKAYKRAVELEQIGSMRGWIYAVPIKRIRITQVQSRNARTQLL